MYVLRPRGSPLGELHGDRTVRLERAEHELPEYALAAATPEEPAPRRGDDHRREVTDQCGEPPEDTPERDVRPRLGQCLRGLRQNCSSDGRGGRVTPNPTAVCASRPGSQPQGWGDKKQVPAPRRSEPLGSLQGALRGPRCLAERARESRLVLLSLLLLLLLSSLLVVLS